MNRNFSNRFAARSFRPNASSAENRFSVGRVDLLAIGTLVIHIPLALLISKSSALSTLHCVLTVAISIGLACRSRNNPHVVAYAGAYIIGAEILWRMTGAATFWEIGKYATIAIFVIALMLRPRRRLPKAPLVYFALLMPSTILTAFTIGGLVEFHKAMSFYVLGPLALAAAWCFFSQLQLSPGQMQRVYLSLLCPTVGVAAIAFFGTITASKLVFTDESNFITSGGFGPNQVAGALSLGAVFALLWLMTSKGSWINKLVIFAALTLVATQAALTFSRGGLYNAAGASVAAAFFLLRDKRSRGRVIMAIGILAAMAVFVIVPRLQEFTGGAISTRYQNVDVAHRDTLIRSDLSLWRENPIFGVGPGMSAVHRRVPHTEISRLLAEHGVFGLAALLVILISGFQAIRSAQTNTGKALSSSMIGFSLLFMMDKAMRLAAPSFAFGLAFTTLTPKPQAARRQVSSAARRSYARRRVPRLRHEFLVSRRRTMLASSQPGTRFGDASPTHGGV